MESVQFLFQNVISFFSNFSIVPTYIQVGSIIILLFLLVISLAQVRHHFIKWSFKGGLIGLFFGVVLTLILEGFLIINGNTVITGILGWKTAPKPIGTALDIGREKLTNVLGVEEESRTSTDVITIMQSLNPAEVKKVKAIICEP